MRRLFLTQFILIGFVFAQIDGEYVKNVTGSQRTDGSKILDIYYDLESSDLYTEYNISVQLEWPGMDHAFYLDQCGGDEGLNIFPGENKHITCQLGEGVEDQFLSGEFYINVLAEASAASEHPFEMTTVNANEQSYIFNYDYELMKNQVTAAQYVDFLNAYLSTAEEVLIMDSDYWEDMEGGEIFHRLFQFENAHTVEIIYNVNDGSGRVQYYSEMTDIQDTYPPYFLDDYTYFGEYSSILNLSEVNDEDNYPKIQFSSTAAGADDFSFFISPGKGNYPIIHVSPAGADLFATFYGLRLPTVNEYKVPIFYEFYEYLTAEEGAINIDEFLVINEYDSYGSDYPETSMTGDSGIVSVEDAYPYATSDFVALLSNVGEYCVLFAEDYPNEIVNNAYIMTTSGYLVFTAQGPHVEYLIDQAFLEANSWNRGGFRCARTIPDSYTGNDE